MFYSDYYYSVLVVCKRYIPMSTLCYRLINDLPNKDVIQTVTRFAICYWVFFSVMSNTRWNGFDNEIRIRLKITVI